MARESDETRALVGFLRRHEIETTWARDGEGAFHVLDRKGADCLVTELCTPRIEGLGVLRRARQVNPEVCAVVIVGPGEIEHAVEAIRQGASDYQVRPLQLERLLAVVRHGLSHQRLAARVAELEDRLERHFGSNVLTGCSRAIRGVMDQVRHVASTRSAVLIEGEVGTGKGVLAQAIHQLGPRRNEPFIGVHCETQDEVEIFGDERPAPAGPAGPRRGRLEDADGGTLFFDEIGGASASVQVRLLRFLQDRAFERVGGTETLRSDVRFVAASRSDLTAEVRAGRFREDLCDRLSVVRVRVPPLRERVEDIPLLVEAFLAEFNREHGRRVTGLTRGALDRLVRHAWTGNVRELRNTLEGMVVFAVGRRMLDVSDLPDRLRGAGDDEAPLDIAVGTTVEGAERALIAATLRHAGNDKTRAAALLGIGLRTLYRKIRRYSIH